MSRAERLELDPYGLMVDFYDRWSSKMTEDVPFYVARALEARGPVVELGAGQGRIAIPIARAGRRVIAVDASPAMRAEGMRRADQAGVAAMIDWVDADMRTFVAEPPTDLVIVPFRSFLHLLTIDDQLACLDAVRRSLVPGGRFVCNFFLPDPAFIVAAEGKRAFQIEFTDERGRRNEISTVPTYRIEEQRASIRVIQEVFDGERLADVTEATLELRHVHRFEMEHLLARSGFEVEAMYGWFDERPLGEGDREMVWVARRR